MRRIIIALLFASIIGSIIYHKLTNISTYKLEGYWNTMNGYSTDKNDKLLPRGYSPLLPDGSCQFPLRPLEPKSYMTGQWKKIRKNGKVYIAFSTLNPFYNDTFLIAYFNQTKPYSTMVLETEVKKILLRKLPSPLWGNQGPGNEWPKEYLDKKKKESERNNHLKEI